MAQESTTRSQDQTATALHFLISKMGSLGAAADPDDKEEGSGSEFDAGDDWTSTPTIGTSWPSAAMLLQGMEEDLWPTVEATLELGQPCGDTR